MFHVPHQYRVRTGMMGSNDDVGNNGLFMVPIRGPVKGQTLKVVASDQLGWEHVSVSRRDRCPVWEEMCQIKAMFWDDEDVVVEYHAPRSEWVSNHDHCLHLWRPVGIELPRPPSMMVGVVGMDAEQTRQLLGVK